MDGTIHAVGSEVHALLLKPLYHAYMIQFEQDTVAPPYNTMVGVYDIKARCK